MYGSFNYFNNFMLFDEILIYFEFVVIDVSYLIEVAERFGKKLCIVKFEPGFSLHWELIKD